MADLINALKRLERAGSENSRATEKLHEAAKILAEHVEQIVPRNVELPRRYVVRSLGTNNGSSPFLVYTDADEYGESDHFVGGYGGYLGGDLTCYVPAQTRETSLAFAHDVATGWLDELAGWLEKRGAESAEAAAVVERAAGTLRLNG